MFVDDYINGGWFLFYWGFSDGCAQFQGIEMSSVLFQDFMDGYIKP